MRLSLRFHLILLSGLSACMCAWGCGGDEPDTSDELSSYDRGSDGALSAQQVVGLADAMFDFDPVIDAAATAEQNASNILAHTRMGLGACGTVTATRTMLTVNFGAPPGCTINGVSVSGSLNLTVSKSGSSTSIAMSFSSLVINGGTYNGTASFVTSNGSAFTVTANLTKNARTYQCNLTVQGVSGAYTLSGTISSVESGVTTMLTLNMLHYTKGDCYPDSGTVVAKQGVTQATITFSASSANSGVVIVSYGRKSTTKTLPAYGSCPVPAV